MNMVKLDRLSYFVDMHVCKKIGVSKFNRLFAVQLVTDARTYADTPFQLRWML